MVDPPPARAPNPCESLHALLHGRNGARLELPSRHLAVLPGLHRAALRAPDDCAACRAGEGLERCGSRGVRGDDHLAPGAVLVIGLLPAPRVPRAVDRIARSSRVVVSHARGRGHDRCVRRIEIQPPPDAGIHVRRFGRAVPLHQKTRAMAVLRDRSRSAPVPDHGGDDVAAAPEVRRQVERLVAPVVDVGALRPGRDLCAVDVQAIAIVGRDVNDEGRWDGAQLKRLPGVEDGEAVARYAGRRDPPRSRRVVENAPVLGVQRSERMQDQREDGWQEETGVRVHAGGDMTYGRFLAAGLVRITSNIARTTPISSALTVCPIPG